MATKKEIQRQMRQSDTLVVLGFTREEAESLRRISTTLQRWHERECNGEIQRGDDGIARGYRVNARFLDPNDPRYWYAVPDREAGAIKRLQAIITARNGRYGHQCDDRNWRCDDGSFDTVTAEGDVRHQNLPAEKAVLLYYLQTDPRGAALYIIRPGDVPEGADVSAYYSRGICVY